MGSGNSNNKRRSKRYPFRKRVKYGQKESRHIGYTLNISRDGIVIESSKMFPEETPLLIEISDELKIDDNDQPTRFLGKVVWSKFGLTRTGKMGIEYLTHSKNMNNAYELRSYH